MDVWGLPDERGRYVRQRRVVLASRRLRLSSQGDDLAGDGARKPGPRGERAISVKTIAQGMPDDPAEPCMGSKLSRERRLLGAIFGAEVRRGQGWPKATAGGGASAALSATNSAR